MPSSSRPIRRSSQRDYLDQDVSIPTRTSTRRATSIISNNYNSHADTANSFPGKLYSLITHESTDLIEWLPHGRAFRINDPGRFATEIVPAYFKHTKLSSFQRQLNLYGFRRIIKGEEIGAYFHPYFIRGREDLVSEIRRIATKSLLTDSTETSDDLSQNLTLGIASKYTDLTSYGIKIVTDVEQTKSIAIATAQMEKNTRARQVSKYPASHYNHSAHKPDPYNREIENNRARKTQHAQPQHDSHHHIENTSKHTPFQQQKQDSTDDKSLDFQFIFPSLSIKHHQSDSNQSSYIPLKGKMSKLSMNIGFDKILSQNESGKHNLNEQQLWKPESNTKIDNMAPTPLMNPLMNRSLVSASALTQGLYKTYINSNSDAAFVNIFENQEIQHSGSQVVSKNDFIAMKSLNRRNQDIEVSSPKRARLDSAGNNFFACANAIIAKSSSFDQFSQPLLSRGHSFQSMSDDYYYASQNLSVNQSLFKHNTSLGNLSQYNDDNTNTHERTVPNNLVSVPLTTDLDASLQNGELSMTQGEEMTENEYLLMDIDDNSQLITDNDYSILLQALYSQSSTGIARSYSAESLVIDV